MPMTPEDRFVDITMRPIAERSIQLYYDILSATQEWRKVHLVDDGTVYDAQRVTEGIDGVPGTDCFKAKTFLLAVKNAAEEAGVMDALGSLAVRPPKIPLAAYLEAGSLNGKQMNVKMIDTKPTGNRIRNLLEDLGLPFRKNREPNLTGA